MVRTTKRRRRGAHCRTSRAGLRAIVFEDGSRVPGMADLQTLQRRIDDVAAAQAGKKS